MMKIDEIEKLSRDTFEDAKSLIKEKNYKAAREKIVLLSHRNLSLMHELISEAISDGGIIDENFKLELALFQSEQKLNQQETEVAAELIEGILVKALNCQNRRMEILALLQKAVLNLYLNKQEESIVIFEQCEQFLCGVSDDTDLAIEVYTYGYHFYSETDTQKAGEYIFRALSLAEHTNNLYRQAYCLMHLGTLNTILNNNDVAIDFFGKAFELFIQLKLNIPLADNLMCQFNIYYRKAEFPKAVDCLLQAITFGENCGWDHKLAICYGNLSVVYLQLAQYDEAKKVAQKDIEMSTRLNNMYNVGVATFRMGKVEAELGNLNKAIELINQSIEIRRNKITNTQLLNVYQYLFPIYAKIGDYKHAFEVQSQYMQLKFEIVDAEKSKENEALRTKYEVEKREAELKEARLQQTESELKALKAQMNPHFIFNALNSIQEIFFLGDKRLANKHLSRFSQLMRNILKASGKKTITLQEEIDMLQEYLSLEALRFGENFSFEITVDEYMDTYIFDVPPMVIQPFVENAVKHGLLHKEGNQKIEMKFDLNDAENIIRVEISDNGIGRKKSAEINKHRSNHESFSTSATEKRFEILNQNSDSKFSFEYFDLENEAGNAEGTKVVINLPI